MIETKLIHGDCLTESEQIQSGSVDLILTDLPYGTIKGACLDGWGGIKTDWDVIINPKKIMSIANRILRKNGKMCLFAQQPFTTELINNALPNLPHLYNMIWEKDHFANALTSQKAPVNCYEDIVIFGKNHDTDAIHPLRPYFENVLKFIGLNKKQIIDYIGQRVDHTLRFDSTQFSLCTEDTYNELIKVFNIDKMEGFKEYNELANINQKFLSTFNLWEGKKFKSNILKYKKDYTKHHPTQKPVLLLEDLIKTFSNENDLIVDLTMGSGSTGVACKNTNRRFIGIELNEGYFNTAQKRLNVTVNPVHCQIAEKRIKPHLQQTKLFS